jgi:hypothetical protein
VPNAEGVVVVPKADVVVVFPKADGVVVVLLPNADDVEGNAEPELPPNAEVVAGAPVAPAMRAGNLLCFTACR